MSVWYYPVMAGAAAITAIAGAAVSKYKKSAKGIFFKVAALALFAAFFVRFYLFGNEYIMNSSALSVPEGFPNRSYVALGAVQVWLSETALFLLVLFPFYRAKWLDRLAAAVGGELLQFSGPMFHLTPPEHSPCTARTGWPRRRRWPPWSGTPAGGNPPRRCRRCRCGARACPQQRPR